MSRPHTANDRPSPLGQSALLDESYQANRILLDAHGKTYALASRALAADKQPHVWALYGFARFIDDIVDEPEADATPETIGTELAHREQQLYADLDAGSSSDPVYASLVNTILTLDLDRDLFTRFFRSMNMDNDGYVYRTVEDVELYTDGSAAVIGEMMLPLLSDDPSQELRLGARSLGIAFQLTNFIRDIGDDLDRNRVYMPGDDLDRHGVNLSERRVDDAFKSMLAEQIERNRQVYTDADPAVNALTGRAGWCIRGARRMYAEILDEIEKADYDVFSSRATVSKPRRAAIFAKALKR